MSFIDRLLSTCDEYIHREDLKKVVVLSVFVILLALYTWSFLFSLIVKIDFEVYNPFYIVKLAYYDVQGPYLETFIGILVVLITVSFLMYDRYLLMGSHGRARWGNGTDLKKADMFESETIIKGVVTPSVMVGKYWGKFVYASGTESLFVYAPTGGGKGVGICIPNLLNWDHSAIVLDAKVENFNITSGFRKKHGQKVYLWNPGAPYHDVSSDNKDFDYYESIKSMTDRFNPLDLIPRHNLLRIDGIQKVWEIFFPVAMDNGLPWGPSARSLALSISLYLMDHGDRFTFGEIRRTLNVTANFGQFIESLLARHYDESDSEFKLDAICLMNFNEFLQKHEKERTGVVSTLNSGLDLFVNPFVDMATSASDFDVRKLRKERMTIYLGVTPGNIKRLAPLFNLFFQSVISVMTEKEPGEDEPFTALLLMDEFPLLGKMDVLKDGSAFLRSYRLKPLIICQSKSQMNDLYGEMGARTLFQNCKVKNAFVPNDIHEASEISKQLGTKTIKTESKSHSRGNVSTSTSYTGRELMRPEEVMTFTKQKSILLVENSKPIKVRKIKWYRDKLFKDRQLEPVAIQQLDVQAFRDHINRQVEPVMKKAFEAYMAEKAEKSGKGSLKDISPAEAKSLADLF